MSKDNIYQNNECYLCKSKELSEVDGVVKDYKDLKILKCENCGLVFLENFNHINDIYYENSQMLSEAHLTIDKWEKENYSQNKKRAQDYYSLLLNQKALDFGCGEGGFLRNIRPFTLVCGGIERAKILREKIVNEQGLQVFPSVSEVQGKFDVITMFHVIEHLKDPIQELRELDSILQENGTIIIETPNCEDALLSFYTCKAFSNFTYWGCHLYLFSKETLRETAERAGYKVNYIKQIQRYPLSNHLHWLAHGKPDGHKIWACLNNETLNNAYEMTLANLGICDTLVASISKGNK